MLIGLGYCLAPIFSLLYSWFKNSFPSLPCIWNLWWKVKSWLDCYLAANGEIKSQGAEISVSLLIYLANWKRKRFRGLNLSNQIVEMWRWLSLFSPRDESKGSRSELEWSRGGGGIGEDSAMTERLMSANRRFLLFNIPFVYWRTCLIGLAVTGP